MCLRKRPNSLSLECSPILSLSVAFNAFFVALDVLSQGAGFSDITNLIGIYDGLNAIVVLLNSLKKFGSSEYFVSMRCCAIPCSQTDAGSSQKHFLPFRVLLNVGIDPNFPQKGFFKVN